MKLVAQIFQNFSLLTRMFLLLKRMTGGIFRSRVRAGINRPSLDLKIKEQGDNEGQDETSI